MGEAIAGGAYLATDGTTWHDANGQPLSKTATAEAQKLHAERQKQREEQERQLLASQPIMVRLQPAFAPEQLQAAASAVTEPAGKAEGKKE